MKDAHYVGIAVIYLSVFRLLYVVVFSQSELNISLVFVLFKAIIIYLTSRSSFLFQFKQDFYALLKQILIKYISIGSCFPEVRAFGSLIPVY